MHRRQFLKTLATATTAAATARWLPAAPHIAKKTPPNLLFLTTDQWHPDTFSHLGNPHLKTPNSDRLAGTSTRFSQAYTAFPVCTPARCSWMTGRMPTEHLSRPPQTMPDIGQWFSAHDYHTLHLGKWDVPGHNPQKSFHIAHEGWTLGQYSDPGTSTLAASYILSRQPSDKPWLLHLGLMNPHDICQPSVLLTQNNKQPYLPTDQLPPLPSNFNSRPDEPQTLVTNIRQSWKRMNLRDWTEADWRLYIYLYYRYCEQADSTLAQILDALDATKATENTLIIYTSDHGEGAGHHALYTKGYLYDESVRIPLYLSFPAAGIPTNKTTQQLAAGTDIFPTLCAAAGISTPKNLLGQNLIAATKTDTPQREAILAQASFNGRMVRSHRYKLITYAGDPTHQLFDMHSDPQETKNLAKDPAHSVTLTRHQHLLTQLESQLLPAAATGASTLNNTD